MGIAGALVALLAATLALVVLPAVLAVLGPRVNALAPKRLQRAADRDARPGAERGLVPPVAVCHAPAGTDRGRQRGVPDRARDSVHRCQVRHGRRASVLPHERERAPGRRHTQHASSRPTAPRRSRSSSAHLPAHRRSGRWPRGSAACRTCRPWRRRSRPGARNAAAAVAPVQRPLSDATKQLVRDIRAIHAPVYVGVAGQTAAYLDLEHSLGAHLPAVLAVIIAVDADRPVPVHRARWCCRSRRC